VKASICSSNSKSPKTSTRRAPCVKEEEKDFKTEIKMEIDEIQRSEESLAYNMDTANINNNLMN